MVMLGHRVGTLFLKTDVKGGERKKVKKVGLTERHFYLGQLTKGRLGSGKFFGVISPKGNHVLLLSF